MPHDKDLIDGAVRFAICVVSSADVHAGADAPVALSRFAAAREGSMNASAYMASSRGTSPVSLNESCALILRRPVSSSQTGTAFSRRVPKSRAPAHDAMDPTATGPWYEKMNLRRNAQL